MWLLAIAITFGVFGALPGPVRADDWLALYPECGFGPEARALGRMALIYPRVGLPAVVSPGEVLTARVRVPSGLTPPPGVQKDRALVGWSAELVGQSARFGEPAEHRYRTRVFDVRPDGQSTLVYRASVHIPVWAAPGTYGLRMTAPGGRDAVAGAVRILEPGTSPRIAFLSPAFLEGAPDEAEHAAAFLAAAAAASVDVVVGPANAPLLGVLAGAPVGAPLPAYLALEAGSHLDVVLRVAPGAVWHLGGCDDRNAPFADQLAALERRRGLTSSPLSVGDLPSRGLLDREGAAVSLPAGPPVVVETDGVFNVTAGPGALAGVGSVIAVHYPDDGRTLVVSGAEASYFPAVRVPMTGEVRSIVARFVLPPGASAELRRGPRQVPEARVTIVPAEVETGQPVHVSLESGADLALIGWRVEEDITLVGSSFDHAYRPVGEQLIDAFAISRQGVGAAVRGTARVETREVHGCGACGIAGNGPVSADLWLAGLVLLSMVVRRRGNRPPPAGR